MPSDHLLRRRGLEEGVKELRCAFPVMDEVVVIINVVEEGEHDEAKLYELEDGRMYMEMGGRRYMMQEMEEEELDEKLTNLPDDAMYDEESGQVVVPHDKQAE